MSMEMNGERDKKGEFIIMGKSKNTSSSNKQPTTNLFRGSSGKGGRSRERESSPNKRVGGPKQPEIGNDEREREQKQKKGDVFAIKRTNKT